MTEQQIDRDRLRASAESALACGTFDGEVLSAVPQLLDLLEQAERDRDWLFRSSRLAKEGRIKANARADQAEAELDSWMARAYEAEGKLWRAEARIESLEDAAHVLVGEVLAAEDARDEHRRGKVAAEERIAEEKHLRMKATAAATKAEARIKAVEELCDTAPDDADLDPLSAHYSSGYELALQDIRRALEG